MSKSATLTAPVADDIVKARIPHKTKEEVAQVLETLGMNPSQLIRMVFATVAREGTVPAVLLEKRRKTTAAMAASRAGKGKRFTSVQALMDDLNDGADE